MSSVPALFSVKMWNYVLRYHRELGKSKGEVQVVPITISSLHVHADNSVGSFSEK